MKRLKTFQITFFFFDFTGFFSKKDKKFQNLPKGGLFLSAECSTIN